MFQQLVQSKGLSFLEEMDAWLSDNEIDFDTDNRKRSVRPGVGVYLIHDDGKQRTIDVTAVSGKIGPLANADAFWAVVDVGSLVDARAEMAVPDAVEITASELQLQLE